MTRSAGRVPWYRSLGAHAALLGLIAFALLARANPGPPMTDDGVRDQLYVRDCVELSKCHTMGAPTSVQGINQGADWIDLLIGVHLLGGNAAQEHILVLALNALAVALLFVAAARWLVPAIAFPSAIVALAVLLRDGTLGHLINPNAAFLPDLLCAALLLAFALTGRSRWLVGAAFLVGIAVNVHVAAAALVPSILLVAALASERPLLAITGAAAVMSATAISSSWDAWYTNLIYLQQHAPLRPALAALVGALAIALACRRRFRALSPGGRATACGLLLVLPFAFGTLVLMLILHHAFGLTYIYPVLAPAAVMAVALVHHAFGARSWVTWPAGALACVALIATPPTDAVARLQRPRAAPGWSMADLHRISGWMTGHGWTWEQAMFRIQGPECRGLFAGLAMDMPRGSGGTVDPARTVRVRFGEAPRPGETAIPLDSGRTALIGETRSWLRPGSLRACRVLAGGSPSCVQPLPRIAAEAADPSRFLFSTRSFPGLALFDEAGRYTARYIIPLVPDGPGVRTFELTSLDPICDWKIESVDGATAEGPLPATRVRVRSSGGVGHLVLVRPVGLPPCPAPHMISQYPPCMLEEPALPSPGGVLR